MFVYIISVRPADMKVEIHRWQQWVDERIQDRKLVMMIAMF